MSPLDVAAFRAAPLTTRPFPFVILPGFVRADALAAEMTAALRREIAEERRLNSKLRQAQKIEAIGILARGDAQTLNVIFCEIIQQSELAANDSTLDGRRRWDAIAGAGGQQQIEERGGLPVLHGFSWC